jgi:hypothetical protein
MEISWDEMQPGSFDAAPIVCPGRFNFQRGALYRLRLTQIPDLPGQELYPTLEIAYGTPRSEAFLSHNAIPVYFTPQDFEHVTGGNLVTKVIYLPDPEFQELALAAVGELVSTQLDPGVDPIEEADHRGAILAIVRLGNKDLLVPGSEDAAGVLQAGYDGFTGEDCGPMGAGGSGSMGVYTAGVGLPQYGMPISGTPIGLPGPPHVPLGGPAGLKKHVVRNHTLRWIPGPAHRQVIDVKQIPGFAYPRPPRHALIVEGTTKPPVESFASRLFGRHQHH